MAPSSPSAAFAALKARVARIERGGAVTESHGVAALGLAAVDGALPGGGLALGAVHEVTGSAAGGFAAVLAGRLAGPVLWCVMASSPTDLYGPGLAGFGLDTRRLMIARCANRRDMLWAVEEGLRDPALAAVVAEPDAPVALAASRRLQLAAETGGTVGLILRRDGEAGALAPSAVFSRWQVEPAPVLGSAETRPRHARWRLALLRCRGNFGKGSKTWLVDWCDATGDLSLAADPGDRPLAARGERRSQYRRAG